MKAYSMIAADLFAVLAVTFMVSLGVLAPLVQNEVLTFMETTKTDKKTDDLAPDQSETALLKVVYQTDHKTVYQLEIPGKAVQKFNDYQQMLIKIKQEQPGDLRLRVDRRVDSGVFQDVILDSMKLDIRVWQVSDGS